MVSLLFQQSPWMPRGTCGCGDRHGRTAWTLGQCSALAQGGLHATAAACGSVEDMKRHQLLLPAGLLIAASERCGALISLSPHAREACHSRLRPDEDRRTLDRGQYHIDDVSCNLQRYRSIHLDEPSRTKKDRGSDGFRGPNETSSHGARDTFAQRLRELEEYRREHGHCSVPRRYRENPSLANWVNKQRQHYRKRMKGGKSPLTEVGVGDFKDHDACRSSNLLGFQTQRLDSNDERDISRI